jgi:hypothetical protein
MAFELEITTAALARALRTLRKAVPRRKLEEAVLSFDGADPARGPRPSQPAGVV